MDCECNDNPAGCKRHRRQTPEDEVRVNAIVSPYSILNHLGYEVGTVTTGSDVPVVAYAIKVNVPSKTLVDAGYTAKLMKC